MKIRLLEGMDEITRGVPKKLKEPTHADRAVENAHHAKVSATDSWVRGEMTSKEHAEVHKRADKVISCKGKL